MDGSSASLPVPNKRQRIQTLKGKEKMEEEATTGEEEETTCGICLADGAWAVSGRIDSCDHFFCFICIMEWAKVESRCPMCKQRFHFIRRPEVPCLFTSELVVEIPVRDQVYHPQGNESTAVAGPYAQVNCSLCHGFEDEELLLLCDLCDLAYHTYCAGMGYTVPEGDWYCHDCTILREEHAKIDGYVADQDQDYQCTHELGQLSEQPISVFEIVADERSSAIESSEQKFFPQKPVSGNDTSQQSCSEGLLCVEEWESSSSPAQVTHSNLEPRGFEHKARTLQHCCNLQGRIHALRENWNALRSGLLGFSSASDSNGSTPSDTTQRTYRIKLDLSQKSKSSSLVNSEQLTVPNSSSRMPTSSASRDVKKAWKMMQKAKTQKLAMANSSLNLMRYNHLNSSGTITVPRGAGSNSLNLLISKRKMTSGKVVGSTTSGSHKHSSTKILHKRCESLGFHRQLPDTETSNQWQHSNRVPVNTSSVIQFTSFKIDKVLPQKIPVNLKDVSRLQLSKFNETTCSSLSSATCEAGMKTLEVCCNKELPQDAEKASNEKACRISSKGYGISDKNAKWVVQSLVKLNLRLLSKGLCLGNEGFKEIARTSTHSILAACGLEHSKSCAHPFSNPVCVHTRQMQQLHRPSLMPDSCRECFFVFVKDVVKSVLFEKNTSTSHSR